MAEDCGCDGDEEFAALADAPDDATPDLHPDPRGNTVRRFSGLVAPYNLPTGDGRRFASGALGNRELPVPLKWQRTDNQGHATSVVVGRIDGLDYKDDGVYAWGIVFDPEQDKMPQLNEDCNEAWHLLGNKVIGPSVDLDDMQFHQLSDPSELAAGARPEIEVTKGRISAATLVPIPAFAEARPFTLDDLDADEYAEMTAVTASGVVQGLNELPVAHEETWDLVRWLLEPGSATTLYSGEHGDLFPVAREVDGQMSLVPAAVADAISVFSLHEDTLSIDEGAKSALRERLEELAATCGMESPPWVRDRSLVAAGAPVRSVKPLVAFQDPKLTRPTPVQLERMDDGTVRVYGHVADWKTCHIGFQDRCVTAPRSKAAYAHFHKGSVLTEDGVLPTGKITIGGGHADTSLSFAAAAQHYDDVSSCVADVRAGEDKHGIWVAGVVRPGTDQNRLDELASSPLSGDWRRIGGSLELIAALAVNTPGFPLPEVAEDRSGALALVAAGVVVNPDAEKDAAQAKKKGKRKPMPDGDGDDDDHDYRYSADEIADAVFTRMQKADQERRETATLVDQFAEYDLGEFSDDFEKKHKRGFGGKFIDSVSDAVGAIADKASGTSGGKRYGPAGERNFPLHEGEAPTPRHVMRGQEKAAEKHLGNLPKAPKGTGRYGPNGERNSPAHEGEEQTPERVLRKQEREARRKRGFSSDPGDLAAILEDNSDVLDELENAQLAELF